MTRTGLRAAGLLGSMGSIGDAFDNPVAESFFGRLQLELLDRHSWRTSEELASAIFERIECFYNPTRRHSHRGMLSPVDTTAARSPHRTRPGNRVNLSTGVRRHDRGGALLGEALIVLTRLGGALTCRVSS